MYLVFDIGGSSIKVGHVNENHEIIKKTILLYKDNIASWDNLKDCINKYLLKVLKTENVDEIDIACPGAINIETGEVLGYSSISGLANQNLKSYLEKKYNINVYVENDANCAGLAELKIGNARNVNNCLMCVIGTGVGGSLIINKQLYHGSNYFAGEYGTMYEGKLPSFLKNQKKINYKFTSFYGFFFTCLNYKILTGKEKNGKELFESYNFDKYAKKVIDEMIFGISKTIANIALVIDPQLVLIGGAVSNNEFFLEKVNDKVSEIFKKNFHINKKFVIKKAFFGNDANIIGASYLNSK